jgi:hypothetical protein
MVQRQGQRRSDQHNPLILKERKATYVGVNDLDVFTADVIGEGLFPQVDELIFFVGIKTVPSHFQLG